MRNDIRKPPLRPSVPGGSRAERGVKAVPGPALRDAGGTMPCGCKVELDPDAKLSYSFCQPHELAYEMLGSLQAIQPVIDDLMNNVNGDYDTTSAMEAGIKVRKVLQRAQGDWR
jgi:hypothetical protein